MDKFCANIKYFRYNTYKLKLFFIGGILNLTRLIWEHKYWHIDSGTQTQPQWSRPNDSIVSTAMVVNHFLGRTKININKIIKEASNNDDNAITHLPEPP